MLTLNSKIKVYARQIYIRKQKVNGIWKQHIQIQVMT